MKNQTTTVSIITPLLNQAQLLAETLRAVREQDYLQVEHIIVDGSSTDGSVEILRGAPKIRWLSEPDRGPADAITKGIRLAKGDVLACLNAGDTINSDAISAAVAAFERTGADLVYGDLDLLDEQGQPLRELRGCPFDARILLYGRCYIYPQTTFFRRQLLEQSGLLREEMQHGFNRDLWLRMSRYGKFAYVPEIRGQTQARSIARPDGPPNTSPLHRLIELYYRGKLQFRQRWQAPPSRRWRILTLGYLPPPIFGPAIAYQALMRSEFPRRCRVAFINMNIIRNFTELEVFRFVKLLRFLRYYLATLRQLLTRRWDFYFYPVSFNRNAFLKDVLMLAPARALGVPIVLYGHGNGLLDFRARSPRWMQWVMDRTLRWAKGAFVPGQALRFNFLQHLPEEQVIATINGMEVPSPLPAPRKVVGRFTVLYLGNLLREKGVFVILDAIPQVLSKRPEAHFVFAGAWWSQSDRQEAERIVSERGIQSHVEFVGVVAGDAKWRALVDADLLVFPTYYGYETLGQVLLEAMAVGLPVIATRRVAIPEIIEENINGLFVEERNSADLAAKIVQLAGDPALRARMGRANRSKFNSGYTHWHYGRRILAAFEKLARRS